MKVEEESRQNQKQNTKNTKERKSKKSEEQAGGYNEYQRRNNGQQAGAEKSNTSIRDHTINGQNEEENDKITKEEMEQAIKI